MAFYQNTSEYYCGVTMDTYPEHCAYPNVYFDQNPTNYQYTPSTSEPVFHRETRPHHNHHNHNYLARKHRAQITILPSSKGNFKVEVKRKRTRTYLTTNQIEALEEIFKTKQYINRDETQQIVNSLQLDEKVVKIWFQNRRMKSKKEKDQEEQEVSSSTDFARLDFIEDKIREKTNENGFVTLDEGVMENLAHVIDEYLTKDNEHVPVNESPLYEPISPASSYESNSDDSDISFKPVEPQECLQKLFDINTMLWL